MRNPNRCRMWSLWAFSIQLAACSGGGDASGSGEPLSLEAQTLPDGQKGQAYTFTLRRGDGPGRRVSWCPRAMMRENACRCVDAC